MPNPTTLEDILNVNIDDIEDIPLTPKGTYLVLIKGMPEQGVSSLQQTPFWRYKFTAIEALEDVDADGRDLIGEIGGLQNLDIQHDFYMTDKALPMFRNFAKQALGLSKMSVKEVVAESAGKQLKVHVSHRPMRGRPGQEARLQAQIDDFLAA